MSIDAIQFFQRHGYEDSNLHTRQVNTDPSTSPGPTCQSSTLQDYDLPLHIGAIFAVLGASFLGCLIPAITRQSLSNSDPSKTKLRRILHHSTFLLKHFGAGIIFATAFVHLLFEAFSIMSDPCVGNLDFEPAAPAIAMGSCFLMFLLDFLLLRPLRRNALDSEAAESAKGVISASGSLEKQLSKSQDSESFHEYGTTPAHAKLAKWNVFALEAGIVFHSVIIGVTVGSTGGNEFIPLLIAINMHQACEGLGLATRISLLATRTRVHYLLYFAFCITTPLGMAIGTGIRQRYNASDRNTLLTLGVLNSISAGILIYSALVQLMAGDFLYNRSMLSASLKRCLSALAAFVLGAIAMSVLGKWT